MGNGWDKEGGIRKMWFDFNALRFEVDSTDPMAATRAPLTHGERAARLRIYRTKGSEALEV